MNKFEIDKRWPTPTRIFRNTANLNCLFFYHTKSHLGWTPERRDKDWSNVQILIVGIIYLIMFLTYIPILRILGFLLYRMWLRPSSPLNAAENEWIEMRDNYKKYIIPEY